MLQLSFKFCIICPKLASTPIHPPPSRCISGGATKAEFLEELISNLEKDIGEWSNLKLPDLMKLVEAELERLSEQMQRNYLETSQEVESVYQELKSLKAWETEGVYVMVDSSEVHDAA